MLALSMAYSMVSQHGVRGPTQHGGLARCGRDQGSRQAAADGFTCLIHHLVGRAGRHARVHDHPHLTREQLGLLLVGHLAARADERHRHHWHACLGRNAECPLCSDKPSSRRWGLGSMTLVYDEEPGIPLLTFLNSWMRMSVLRVPSGKNSTEAPCCRRSLQVERHLIWLRLSTLFKRTCPARCATSGQALLEAYFLLITGEPRTCEEHAPAHDWYKEIAGLRYELEWPI